MSSSKFRVWLNHEYLPQYPEYLWIKEAYSKAVTQAVNHGQTAFKKFFDHESAFPKFKKKGRSDVKMYFVKNNPKDCRCERHRVNIPSLGWVRIKEKGYIPTTKEGYTIKSGHVSMKAGRYYVSALIEIPDNKTADPSNEGIGIDLGLKDFAIVSNGKTYKNINKSARLKKLENYTSADLRKINEESIREDIPTTSWVEEAKIWSIEKSSKKDYRVEFSVKQKIQEGDKKEKYESFYITNVHKDANGAMVVTQNPTVCGGYSKSNYEKKVTVNDGSVDNNEQLEIEEFLVTFFRLYPTADEKELSYYAEKNVLKPIQEKNDVYVLSEVEIVSAVKEKKITYVQVNVTYLDQQTKAMQISQYDLKLKKEGNWKIVK